MIRKYSFFILTLVLIILGASSQAWNGEFHRWIDEDGTTHYSDMYPENAKNYQTIKITESSPEKEQTLQDDISSQKSIDKSSATKRKSHKLRKIEHFPLVQQERKWCALASMEMVARYYGYNINQMQISIESDTPLEQGMTLNEILKYLNHLKILMLNVEHQYHCDLEKIKRFIDDRIPLIWPHYVPTHHGWSPHVSVVIGYDDGTRRMVIAEPSCGCEMTLRYRDFLQRWQKTDCLLVIVTSRL